MNASLPARGNGAAAIGVPASRPGKKNAPSRKLILPRNAYMEQSRRHARPAWCRRSYAKAVAAWLPGLSLMGRGLNQKNIIMRCAALNFSQIALL